MSRPLSHAIARRSALAAAAYGVALSGASAFAGNYRIERIASNLNQPNYVTQAPGDPSNILYFIERVTPPTDGSYPINNFSKVNHMGRIVRYDVATGVKTTVLDLSSRKVFQDDGLQSVAFSPDFQTTGKMYVVSSEYTGTQAFGSNGAGTQPVPTSRVEEYTVNVANPAAGTTTFNREILNYVNSVNNNHTIDWAGFDPTATGNAKNYLYISTGDGAFGNAYNAGAISNGRPSQNPGSSRGKILRVDVAGADAYPADATKNFAIPASNPIPNYNALHPATPITGNGEVFTTGMRNSYRMSFDRANGNIYTGDVGENLTEEVDFLKAGTNTGATQGPLDYGWPQLEGTGASQVTGAPHTNINPFTNVTSTNPIQQFTHNGGSAVIGGYVYRGPVSDLQGLYYYADFVPGTIRQLNFDPNTAPGTFNGANGTVTDVSAAFNGLVFDRSDVNYTAAGAGDPFGFDHVVSFGEDNTGNMYIVDFGGTAGDGGFTNATGEYPGDGRGEIFKVVLNGDMDRSNSRNATDIDLLLRSPGSALPTSRLYDLNDNGAVVVTPNVANSDADYLVKTLLGTQYGDTNLNRTVDFNDVLTLAQHYGAPGTGSTWVDGDFNGDGKVDFSDLLLLAQNYGYNNAAGLAGTAALASVPEPASVAAWIAVAGTTLLRRRRALSAETMS